MTRIEAFHSQFYSLLTDDGRSRWYTLSYQRELAARARAVASQQLAQMGNNPMALGGLGSTGLPLWFWSLFAGLALLIMPGSAHASWTMDYTTRSDVSTLHTFYGPGAYEFLKTPDYVVVYRFDAGHMTYLGLLGQVELPADLPPIVFPPGSDQLVASDPVDTGLFGGGGGGGGAIMATPEHAVLRRFARHLGGQSLARLVNPTLQRITASVAGRLLRAPTSGTMIFLSENALDVQQWCSGLTTMKWLMLLALTLSLACRLSPASGVLLILLAAFVGLEVNVLRVVGIGWGYHKDMAMWTALSFGVAQVAVYALALVIPERPRLGWFTRR